MNIIILDGEKMTSRSAAHKHIKVEFDFPDYYGENLDALWDMLTTIGRPTEIQVTNADQMKKNLGEYASALSEVFRAASLENKKLIIKY